MEHAEITERSEKGFLRSAVLWRGIFRGLRKKLAPKTKKPRQESGR